VLFRFCADLDAAETEQQIGGPLCGLRRLPCESGPSLAMHILLLIHHSIYHDPFFMAPTQNEKALLFQELHRRPGVLVIPNPWDAGSARILAGLGFEAFTTKQRRAMGRDRV
jgi:hypothetical protein